MAYPKKVVRGYHCPPVQQPYWNTIFLNDFPDEEFKRAIIAIIHRYDDVDEKWVVAPEDMMLTREEIEKQVHFQEQYFKSEIRM